MLKIGQYRVYAGDFHTHWYWDKKNPTVMLAGMNYLGLDFVLLQDGLNRAEECDRIARSYRSGFRFFPGQELCFAFAHIATWIDPKFDAGRITLLQKEGAAPTEFFRKIKEMTQLTIFAHPGKNWSAAFDGTYQPFLNLYRQGMIDAVQIENPTAYLAGLEQGLTIPVLAGFDVHACSFLATKPDYLFRKDVHPFDYIAPCGFLTTLVFAEELSEEAVIGAVKTGKTVVYNIQDNTFVGPPELVKILHEGEYPRKRKALIERKNGISFQTKNVLVGERAEVEIEGAGWDRTSRVYYPDGPDFKTAKEGREPVADIAVGNWVSEPEFYFPVIIKNRRDTHVFAVLAKEPITLYANGRVVSSGGKSRYYLDCQVENNAGSEREIRLAVKSALKFKKAEAVGKLKAAGRKTFSFEATGLPQPGFEYPLAVDYFSRKFSSVKSQLVSFPVCRHLFLSETPWRIRAKEAIVINDAFQAEELAEGGWKGPEDLSCRVNMSWDKSNFYFYAEVTDSGFYQKWIDWETFWGDSVQFVFDPALRKKGRGYGTNYEFCLAKTTRGNEVMVWCTPKPGVRRFLSETARLKVTRDEANQLTKYRFSIPWNSLKPFVPQAGAQFKLSVLVNDNDGTALNRKCVLFYGGNIGWCKDTSLAHTVTLV